MLSSSDTVTVRGVREIVLRPFRPDHLIRPELRHHRPALLDAEPVQVRLRGVLADVKRGARYAPHCDDVGHLPTHPGNYVLSHTTAFVCSEDESANVIRATVLRGVRSDDYRTDESASTRKQGAARVDQLLVQNCVRNVHVDIRGGTDQSAHCYDVRHVPKDPGKSNVNATYHAASILTTTHDLPKR